MIGQKEAIISPYMRNGFNIIQNVLDVGMSPSVVHRKCLDMVGGCKIKSINLRSVYRFKAQWTEYHVMHTCIRTRGVLTGLRKRRIALMTSFAQTLISIWNEIVEWVSFQVEMSISESGLCKLLKKINLSLKVMVKVFQKRSEAAREMYWIDHMQMGTKLDIMVFFDECYKKTGH